MSDPAAAENHARDNMKQFGELMEESPSFPSITGLVCQ